MANRYANLVGANKIKDEYSKINAGFDAVQEDIDNLPVDLYRNAIINGGFDVWQDGPIIIPSTQGITYTADMWAAFAEPDGGNIPSFTVKKLYDTPTGEITAPQGGSIPGTISSLRISTSGAITGYGPNMQLNLSQKIEHGTRRLCGTGRKVSVSFWARCDLPNKRLGVWMIQNYGTGGSPNIQEALPGTNFMLTNAWQKYTFTFTTNPIAGKVFGANNDDYLQLIFQLAWGVNNRGNVGASTDENLIAGANIDIDDVVVNAGDTPLPFQPRSFAEELAMCQRYYEKSFKYGDAPANNIGYAGYQSPCTDAGFGNSYCASVLYRVRKRITPTLTFYNPNNPTPGTWQWFSGGSGTPVAPTVEFSTDHGFSVRRQEGVSGLVNGHWTADARL